MKLKKEYLILLLVIVALILYLALGNSDHPGSDLPRLSALDSVKINRMRITPKGGGTLELVKKDAQWFVLPKNYPVDDIKIKNMVKAAGELTVTAVVSESGNYERYGLDDANSIKVQIYGDDPSDSPLQREFSIGRVAPTQQHTFVLLAKDPNVYHARGNLNATFNQTIDTLRDKTVLAFEKETVLSVQIQKGEQALVLTKTEVAQEVKKEEPPTAEDQAAPAPSTKTQWQSADGNLAEPSSVNALLSSISGLKCAGYMADDAKATLTDAAWTLTLKSDSKRWTFSVFAPKEADADQFPGLSSTNDFAFLLPKYRVQAIEEQIEKLLNPKKE
jgi:hypothetical protein